jgi:predicted CxxxxCH...CXXCH cytochrome family protein
LLGAATALSLAGCETATSPPSMSTDAGACLGCHGGGGSSAPPTSTRGTTATTDVAVGAHQAHLDPGAFRKAIACDECHVVPDTMGAPGHVDGIAAVTFGGLAKGSGASPAWDGARCSGTYCHGGTLPGGSNTAPLWTKVDGTQVACGTCHGVPPPVSSGHPPVSGPLPAACAACHPGTVLPDGSLDLARGMHIDGVVQLGSAACAGCHGDAARVPAGIAAAPPRDTLGNTATTARGVGAHQKHLAGTALGAPVACGECHAVPGDLRQHPDGTVSMSWGPLAKAGGAVPSWDRTTAACANYCHGATLTGGRAVAPVWTRVDGTQSACGACHGVPPPAPHVQDAACGRCHAGYTATTVNAPFHLDGYVQLDLQTCTSCHGDPMRPAAIAAAPPGDLAGNTSTTALGVGAHLRHLTGTSLRSPIACAECHPPITSTSHAVGQHLVVDVTFGSFASAGGAFPVWDHAAATCASTYCHGGTLAGGRLTTPVWTWVDGTQVACGACHGVPPPPPHLARSDCGACHPGFTSSRVDLATHMNGVVDAATLRCTTCHGDPAGANAVAQPAPPFDTAGRSAPSGRGVGAHQKHLVDGVLRRAVACSECHVVPSLMNHATGTVDMTFGPLARQNGAAPSWTPGTLRCSGVYCHGATLTGGTNLTPLWTKVDGTQATCGSCHGIPPPAPHVQNASCGGCHTGYTAASVSASTHIDGVVQVQASCTSCHGDPAAAAAIAPAPPRDSKGNAATSAIGVGAHQAHLSDGALRPALACTECHPPVNAASHPDGTIAMSFGPLARGGGAVPAWKVGTASCATTYCHGATLRGGTVPEPVWTKVDGTQAACGACHGAPPPTTAHAGMTPSTACAPCHPGYSSSAVDPARHIDGVVDATGTSCSSCHGNASRPPATASAPPTDTQGNTATTARGVGAHQRHLGGGAMRPGLPCTECHAVPADLATHPDGAVELTWGPLARTGGATPLWNGTSRTCASSYCHGATLGGGSRTTPVWTQVDGTQAACGTCHGLPPPAPHVQDTSCGRCHTGTTSSTVSAATHVDGQVQISAMTCTSCHGDPVRTLVTGADAQARAAPPTDTRGASASTLRSVGAHLAHVNRGTGAIAAPTACAECHVVPASSTHANGVVSVTFGVRAKTGGVSPTWNGTTCANTYCHGNHTNGSRATPSWTASPGLACTACHAMPPATSSHTMNHKGGNACNKCHRNTDSTGSRITSPALHVNGKVNGLCNDCH